jgi:hypothetical protein
LHHHKIRLHDEIRDLDMEDEERRFKVLERDQAVVQSVHVVSTDANKRCLHSC